MIKFLNQFTLADFEKAQADWGCNCGPGALAAILGLSLETARTHLPEFDARHYTTAGMMTQALNSLGANYSELVPSRVGRRKTTLPEYGLARIQWEGPWTEPRVHWAARQRRTHWIGSSFTEAHGVGVFDINMLNNGSGWSSFENWQNILVPWLLKEAEPEATGGWFITHGFEITLHQDWKAR